MTAILSKTARLKNSFGACVLSILVLVCAVAAANAAVTLPQQADEEILNERALQFMLQVNAARRDPLAAAARLGVAEEVVREQFAATPWILEDGLPPLAWNAELVISSATHGRDMFDRLYYSYVTPEGATVDDRIADTGYEALFVGESMNALFFENYLPVDTAFQALVDSMLRDELRGTAGVERNIFSPDVTEMGAAFFAESIDLLGDQPYVYLLLADFARPKTDRYFICGLADPDSELVLRRIYTGFSEIITPLPGGAFQAPYPDGGAAVTAYSATGEQVANKTVYEAFATHNHFMDLRGVGDPD